MIYELKATFFCDDLDPINDIKDKILDHFNEAAFINPDSPNAEYSSLQVIENHHDENPNQPCFEIFGIDNKPS